RAGSEALDRARQVLGEPGGLVSEPLGHEVASDAPAEHAIDRFRRGRPGGVDGRVESRRGRERGEMTRADRDERLFEQEGLKAERATDGDQEVRVMQDV